MDDVEHQNVNSALVFPKLVNFKTVKVSAERLKSTNKPISMKLNQSSTLALEEAQDSRAEGGSTPERVRVVISMSFDSLWHLKDSDEVIAIYKAEHQAILNFKLGTDTKSADSLVTNKLYRDILLSQVYPIAKLKMNDVMRDLGVNTNTLHGYEIKTDDIAPEGVIKELTI